MANLYVLPEFGAKPVQKITIEHVAQWIAGMQSKGLKANTIRNAMKPLSGAFAYAARKRVIGASPVKGLTRDERPKSDEAEKRTLTSEELGRLLDSTTEHYEVAPRLLGFGGLRAGECVGLNWEDVNLSEGYLHVRQVRDAKTNERGTPKTPESVRKVFLAPSLVQALREHKMASPQSQDNDPVFTRRSGKPLTYESLRQGFKQACQRAGLYSESKPDPTPQSLRHGYGSMLIAEGAPLAYVCGQLGHADPSITARIYTHEFEQARHAEASTAALEARIRAL